MVTRKRPGPKKGSTNRVKETAAYRPRENANAVPDKTVDPISTRNPMSFGDALVCLKLGKKVARKGWNGKNMWLVYVPSSVDVLTTPGTTYYNAGLEKVTIEAHIDMYTAQGTMQPGWLASQSDMLATDWLMV